MQAEKIIKVNQNALIQWIYDDTNLISEDYKILNPDGTYVTSFAYFQADQTLGQPSVTNNLQANKLFRLDPIANRYAKVDSTKYTFLHIQDFPAPAPTRFDTLRIFFPINYTFEDKVGIYVRVYTYDYFNQTPVDLVNFYFDKTDISMSGLVELASPPISFQEKLWGKYLQLQIPSVYEVSSQRIGSTPTAGSLNINLTGGVGTNGLSQTSPIFIDFSFIELSQTVLGTTTFIVSQPFTASVPQVPDFQNVSVELKESTNGDFFEINGIFNNSNEDFATYIENLNMIGQSHYLIYTVTLFEENVPTNVVEYLVNDDYSKIILYRPIIVSSNTTAAIQVELKIINAVDNSQIIKIATLGLLREQISKYSAYLTRINVSNVFKPKIYNVKGDRPVNFGQTPVGAVQKVIQKIDVPFPVMYDRENIIAKDVSVSTKSERYLGIGKLRLKIYPFDNIFKFAIASEVRANSPKPFDLSQTNDVQLVFKSSKDTIECPLYYDSGEVDLANGIIIFKVTEQQSDKIRKIYENGDSNFYIVIVTENNLKTVIYSSSFLPFDSAQSQINIRQDILNENLNRPESQFSAISSVSRPTQINVSSQKPKTGNLTIKPNGGTAIKINNGKAQ